MADILTQKEMETLLSAEDLFSTTHNENKIHRKVIKVEEDLEYTIQDEINKTLEFHKIDLDTIININEYKRNNYYEIVIHYKGF